MRVLVSFEGGMAAFPDFEIPKFDRQVVAAVEQHLSSHAFEDRPVFFVGKKLDAFPSVVPVMLPNHRLNQASIPPSKDLPDWITERQRS